MSRHNLSRISLMAGIGLALNFLLTFSVLTGQDKKTDFSVSLRSRIETEPGSGNFHATTKSEKWLAAETAIIVCDMWDYQHCHNAVIRVGQMAPRMDSMLKSVRTRGATIIHAPSSCIDFYKLHPARKRVLSIPIADNTPDGIDLWCDQISSEKAGKYPIDQSDGGEDDEAKDHENWAKELASKGLDPKAPWSRQTDALTIDGDLDFISDSGTEIWNVLENKSIKNVLLVGVHTNMCVLGRPFGLRQLAKNGKNVALVRDLTDSMYNPASWPHVSHFSGTDLIVEHIEKYVCPTITCDQLIEGKQFTFPDDKRPHIAIMIAEDEYETDSTLPEFAKSHLQKDFRVSLIFGSKTERNDIPGLEAIRDADLLLLSVRRRTLPQKQLQLVRDYEAAGKPMLGIRTSSHAFCLRKKQPEPEFAAWPEFDSQVWGGNYSGHTKNGTVYQLKPNKSAKSDVVLRDVDLTKINGHMSLYLNAPLAKTAEPLVQGFPSEDETQLQPVVWRNTRANGGLSIYTSLGHVDDFKQPEFQKLLLNAIKQLVGRTFRR